MIRTNLLRPDEVLGDIRSVAAQLIDMRKRLESLTPRIRQASITKKADRSGDIVHNARRWRD